MMAASLFGKNNSTDEDIFSLAENFTMGSMLDQFNSSFPSGGQFGNFTTPGGDFLNYGGGGSGGPPSAPCLHTGDEVLAQLNFYKVGEISLVGLFGGFPRLSSREFIF